MLGYSELEEIGQRCAGVHVPEVRGTPGSLDDLGLRAIETIGVSARRLALAMAVVGQRDRREEGDEPPQTRLGPLPGRKYERLFSANELDRLRNHALQGFYRSMPGFGGYDEASNRFRRMHGAWRDLADACAELLDVLRVLDEGVQRVLQPASGGGLSQANPAGSEEGLERVLKQDLETARAADETRDERG